LLRFVFSLSYISVTCIQQIFVNKYSQFVDEFRWVRLIITTSHFECKTFIWFQELMKYPQQKY